MIPRIPLNFSAPLGIGRKKNERANDPLKYGRESLLGRRGECTTYGKIWSNYSLLDFTKPSRRHNDLNVILLIVNSI
jgi:hypothetical protein